MENLELPEQTALLVEAGPMWSHPQRKTESRVAHTAVLDYGDMADRYGKWWAYPSTHDGRTIVIAADGHGAVVSVEHYDSRHGPHDTAYGRIGGGIYNWNGGHLNGGADRPPRD
jgi:hypothetical protein